jgi:hypothetical protein
MSDHERAPRRPARHGLAAPLLLVAVFSLLLTLAAGAWVLGLPTALIVLSWYFKYAFLMLDHAAHGRPGTPVLSAEDANPLGESRPVIYGAAIAALYGASGALDAAVGATAVSAIRATGLLLLPAILATHVVTGSFAAALHPFAMAATVRGLGIGYLAVLAAALACGALGHFVVFDAGHLALMTKIALVMSLGLAVFQLLGMLIHRRRFELGFDADHAPERRQARDDRDLDRERSRFVDQLFAECRSGSTRNAWAMIERRAGGGAGRLPELEWIHQRVTAWPDPRLANRVAKELLGLLLVARRNGDALEVVRARFQADARFRPATAAETIRLAELARDAGDRPLARRLRAILDEGTPAP